MWPALFRTSAKADMRAYRKQEGMHDKFRLGHDWKHSMLLNTRKMHSASISNRLCVPFTVPNSNSLWNAHTTQIYVVASTPSTICHFPLQQVFQHQHNGWSLTKETNQGFKKTLDNLFSECRRPVSKTLFHTKNSKYSEFCLLAVCIFEIWGLWSKKKWC